MRPHFSAAALLLCSGCLFPLSALTEGRVVRTEVGDFVMKWSPDDVLDVERTAGALERASPKLLRWGKLKKAVSFYLLPTHSSLERTVRRFGFEWMHAWAQYDAVYFQSPATWATADPDVDELVLHELTHCLMYQRSATAQSWPDKQIPDWFREGMATTTANQGFKLPGLEDLARFYEKNPGADPIGRPEELYKASGDVVYMAAHHSFTLLLERYGEPAVLRLMDSMAAGRTFPAAFEEVIGITAAAFAKEFRQYVVTGAFKEVKAPAP